MDQFLNTSNSKSKTTDDNDDKNVEIKKEFDPYTLTSKDIPKRPSTAYFMFVADKRDEIKEQLINDNPNDKVSVANVTKKLGSLWQNLDATIKNNYIEKASKANEEYHNKLNSLKLTKKIINDIKEREKAADEQRLSTYINTQLPKAPSTAYFLF